MSHFLLLSNYAIFAMKDVEYFEKIFDECERMYVRGGDKKRKAEYEILCKIKKVLIEEARMIRYILL